jgi:two-component system, chemotaxis family, chemotaxis protein CheY
MSTTLMIVDDSVTMRRIIMRTMRMSGLQFEEIKEAGNGKEALEVLNDQPIDIILCDVNMPEMNGTELVQQVRQMDSCSHTKIIMVSTESSDSFIEEMLSCGANGYITKPFSPEKFEEKLSPFLN